MAAYKCVMLVDDNEIDNIINEKIIQASNFAENILVFQTGQEGLDYLEEYQSRHHNSSDAEGFPEIIFLDINMPIMDGFQFLDEFEKNEKYAKIRDKCKIIMLSSSISPKDIDRAASSKYVQKYLNKPLNARYLQAISV